MLGLFYPNRATPAAVASNGSWLTALPALNACDPLIAKVARSTNALASSTKIGLDLGASRVLRAFSLVNHNLSATAQWRVLLGTTSGGSDVYSGTLTDWLIASGFEPGLVASGMEDAEYLREGTAAFLVLPQNYAARHVTFEIVDTANVDGYVQIGRVFAGGGFLSTYNAKYGLQDGWIDMSTANYSESGSLWATPRRRVRKVAFVLEALTPAQGEQLHEMQRVLGTVDEVLYVPEVGDPAATQRFGMLGTLSEMTPLEYPYYRLRALPLTVRQKS